MHISIERDFRFITLNSLSLSRQSGHESICCGSRPANSRCADTDSNTTNERLTVPRDPHNPAEHYHSKSHPVHHRLPSLIFRQIVTQQKRSRKSFPSTTRRFNTLSFSKVHNKLNSATVNVKCFIYRLCLVSV